MDELKPCPFCGGEGELTGEVRAFVKCTRCRVRGNSFRFILQDEDSRNEAVESAIKAWNRRAGDG